MVEAPRGAPAAVKVACTCSMVEWVSGLPSGGQQVLPKVLGAQVVELVYTC